MAIIESNQTFERLVLGTIEEAVRQTVEKVIDRAKADLEQQLRQVVGQIALEIASDVNFRYREHEISITIRDRRAPNG